MKAEVTINWQFLYENHVKYVGLGMEGGSRSGKTWAASDFFCWYIQQVQGEVITIGRDKMTLLKKTLLLDFKTTLRKWKLWEDVQYNKSDQEMIYNNNLIRFVGVNDDIMLTHGLTQDVFWLNEAMSIAKDTFDQLEQRTSKFFILDYNPTATRHWLYDLEKRDDYKMFQTTVLDNPFAPPNTRKKILGYEPTEKNKLLGTADDYKWQVYGLGKRTADDKLIFKNWDTYAEEPKEYDLKVFGLDFGYSNDPTTLVECTINGKHLYIKEHLYETGLTNDMIADRVSPILDKEEDCYLVCDSAEPKSIRELVLRGLPAIKCDKGADSIRAGIDKLKTFKIHLHVESLNLVDEFDNYKYMNERIKGDETNKKRVANVPIDDYNHLIDAVRYAVTKFTLVT